MTETKERRLYSLLAESAYLVANCNCTDSKTAAEFLEKVKAELPTELPSDKLLHNHLSLSQLLSQDSTFAAMVAEQLKDL